MAERLGGIMSVAELLESRQQRSDATASEVISHVPEGELRMIVNGLDAMIVTSSDKTGSGQTSTCDGTCVCCC
jgi:hypothetical protein